MSGLKNLFTGPPSPPPLPPVRNFAAELAAKNKAEAKAKQDKLRKEAARRRKNSGRTLNRRTGALGVTDNVLGARTTLF